MNLHEIRMAGIRAAEDAVVRDLQAKGLVATPPSSPAPQVEGAASPLDCCEGQGTCTHNCAWGRGFNAGRASLGDVPAVPTDDEIRRVWNRVQDPVALVHALAASPAVAGEPVQQPKAATVDLSYDPDRSAIGEAPAAERARLERDAHRWRVFASDPANFVWTPGHGGCVKWIRYIDMPHPDVSAEGLAKASAVEQLGQFLDGTREASK